MSWIEEAQVDLPPVISVMSINKQAMEAVQNLNASITFGASVLTRVQEEAIAAVEEVAFRVGILGVQVHHPMGLARAIAECYAGRCATAHADSEPFECGTTMMDYQAARRAILEERLDETHQAVR